MVWVSGAEKEGGGLGGCCFSMRRRLFGLLGGGESIRPAAY